MKSLDKLHIAEAERLAKEAEARRRWEQQDLRRLKENIRDNDYFPDDWLEEAEEYMKDKGGGT